MPRPTSKAKGRPSSSVPAAVPFRTTLVRRQARPFTLVANWKMHLGDAHGLRLARQVAAEYKKIAQPPTLVLCPPFTVLPLVDAVVDGTNIAVGAQDVSWAAEGAHTGEVSAAMLVAAGCSHVIIGHSERRHQLHETDAIVHRKLARALAAGLTPILCVGETQAQREDCQSEVVVLQQLQQALEGVTLSAGQRLLIAYEPVWAIGTHQPVSRDEAIHMAQLITHLLVDGEHYGFLVSSPERQIAILYGGSVEPGNILDFFIPGIISGALVGGASLEAGTFMSLVKAVAGK